MLVSSDQLARNRANHAVNKVKGDLFMVIGATLYGFSERGFFGLSGTPSYACH